MRASEVESVNAQMLWLRAHFYVCQQVRQLLLFHPNIAQEAILECLKSQIFLGGGGGCMPSHPPSGNSLSPDQ